MKTAILLASGLLLLAIVSPTLAGGLPPRCQGTVTEVGPLYIDDRDFVSGNGLWIYLESNGEAGLQRGGSGVLDPIGDATGLFSADEFPECQTANPDTLIF